MSGERALVVVGLARVMPVAGGTGRTMMCRTQAVILAYESGLVQPGAPAG